MFNDINVSTSKWHDQKPADQWQFYTWTPTPSPILTWGGTSIYPNYFLFFSLTCIMSFISYSFWMLDLVVPWSFAIACVLLLVFLPALSGILGNLEQKTMLQTIKQLMQYTVLGIQLLSLKYTTVIRIQKFEQLFLPNR